MFTRNDAPQAIAKIKVPRGSKVIVAVPALMGRNLIPATPGAMDRKAISLARSGGAKGKFGL